MTAHIRVTKPTMANLPKVRKPPTVRQASTKSSRVPASKPLVKLPTIPQHRDKLAELGGSPPKKGKAS
jgi:hypothetical protein